jgi:hypothetical protein
MNMRNLLSSRACLFERQVYTRCTSSRLSDNKHLTMEGTILKSREDSLMQSFAHRAAKSLRSEQANHETVHDPDFRQSEQDWHKFVEKLTERLVEIDDTVPELPVKDIVSCPLHTSLQSILSDH